MKLAATCLKRASGTQEVLARPILVAIPANSARSGLSIDPLLATVLSALLRRDGHAGQGGFPYQLSVSWGQAISPGWKWQRIACREGSSGFVLRAMSSNGAKAFIAAWAAASASERANSQPFLCELCDNAWG